MSQFVGKLDVELINDDPATWRLMAALLYQSDVAGQTFVVPRGFETDLASVPRVPVAYLLFGGAANEAAVIHDHLYSSGSVSRKLADDVLLEAMEVTGVPGWRRYPIYWAVRAFGGSHLK